MAWWWVSHVATNNLAHNSEVHERTRKQHGLQPVKQQTVRLVLSTNNFRKQQVQPLQGVLATWFMYNKQRPALPNLCQISRPCQYKQVFANNKDARKRKFKGLVFGQTTNFPANNRTNPQGFTNKPANGVKTKGFRRGYFGWGANNGTNLANVFEWKLFLAAFVES